MRPRSVQNLSQRSYKRKKIEPFIMFCLHRRSELAAENPHLNCGQVTAALGSIWRALPPEEKEIYVIIAAKQATDLGPRRKRQRRVPKMETAVDTDFSFSTPAPPPPDPENEPDHVAPFAFDNTPYLWIIPRGSFGQSAAAASLIANAAETLPKVLRNE
jgi:hypothetical protein